MITPIGGSSLDVITVRALKAGWYLVWRVAVIYVAASGLSAIIVGLRSEAAVLFLPLLAAIATALAVWRLQPIAENWTVKAQRQRLDGPVRWAIIWRGGLISLAINTLSALVVRYYLVGLSSVLDLMAAVVGVALVVMSIQGWGWAMWNAVAVRLKAVEQPAS